MGSEHQKLFFLYKVNYFNEDASYGKMYYNLINFKVKG